mmetsp:Transcript_22518/g.70654  ORF Transcript_22518/g.70654 Transcript_22518/m.70654 type:complete len:212 (-) Transcript_22518:36-671(-)
MEGGSAAPEAADGAAPPKDVSSEGRGAELAVIFFDFDSTLTVPQHDARERKHALADNPELFSSMSEEEVFASFGGRERVQRLAAMLKLLEGQGVVLFIISLGFTGAIKAHLGTVGLAPFFQAERIYGQDSPEMAKVHHRKAWLITQLLEQHGHEPQRALFVDDDNRNISLCKEFQACPCLHVRGHGLCELEIQAIEAHARGTPLGAVLAPP